MKNQMTNRYIDQLTFKIRSEGSHLRRHVAVKVQLVRYEWLENDVTIIRRHQACVATYLKC